MRAFQYWLLLIGSIVITGMVYKQIALSKAIWEKQRQLTDMQKDIDDGPGYNTAWTTMARFIYEGGKNDPQMIDILKRHRIGVGNQPLTNAPPSAVLPPSAPTNR